MASRTRQPREREREESRDKKRKREEGREKKRRRKKGDRRREGKGGDMRESVRPVQRWSHSATGPGIMSVVHSEESTAFGANKRNRKLHGDV